MPKVWEISNNLNRVSLDFTIVLILNLDKTNAILTNILDAHVQFMN